MQSTLSIPFKTMSIAALGQLAENRFHDVNMLLNRGETKYVHQHPVTVTK